MKRKTLNQIALEFKYGMNLSYSTTNFYVASTPGALQVRQILIDVLEELRSYTYWQHLVKTYTVATSANRAKYPLPKDFMALTPKTQWNSSRQLRLNGPQLDSQMSGYLYGVDNNTYNYAFRIVGPDFNDETDGGQIELSPTPTSAENLVFEYLTSNLFIPPNWTQGQTISGSGVYRNANGYNYVSTGGGTTGSDSPDHTSGTESDGAVSWTFYGDEYIEANSDSDFIIFDPDIVKLGMIYKWKQRKGEEYQAEEMEYRKKIDASVARMRGPAVGRMSRYGNMYRRYQVPDGGWSF